MKSLWNKIWSSFFYLVCKWYLGHLTTIIDVILLIYQRTWQSLYSVADAERDIQNLVLILYPGCKLYPVSLTIMRKSLMQIFCHLNFCHLLSYLSKSLELEIQNLVGLFLICELFSGHVTKVMSSSTIIICQLFVNVWCKFELHAMCWCWDTRDGVNLDGFISS